MTPVVQSPPPPAPVLAPEPVPTPTPPQEAEVAHDSGATLVQPSLDHCPNGMALVNGSFCVERAPVTQREFRQCVNQDGGCTRPLLNTTGCNWLIGPSANSLSVNCVPRAQAHAYCVWRYNQRAGLPTREEWNAIGARRDVRSTPNTREWIAEDTASGMNARGEWQPAQQRYLWVHAPAETGDRATSFRCVVRAGGP